MDFIHVPQGKFEHPFPRTGWRECPKNTLAPVCPEISGNCGRCPTINVLGCACHLASLCYRWEFAQFRNNGKTSA